MTAFRNENLSLREADTTPATGGMMKPTRCAFCGHPDHRHRIVDAIQERKAAGEEIDKVLMDYGLSRRSYREMRWAVRRAQWKRP